MEVTMKWMMGLAMAAVIVLTGCAKKGEAGVDTAEIEKSFASAAPEVKATVEKAVTAIKGADYAGAVDQLKTLAGKADLTPEQKQSVEKVMTQVKEQVEAAIGKASEGVKNAAEEGKKAVGDLQKALPGTK